MSLSVSLGWPCSLKEAGAEQHDPLASSSENSPLGTSTPHPYPCAQLVMQPQRRTRTRRTTLARAACSDMRTPGFCRAAVAEESLFMLEPCNIRGPSVRTHNLLGSRAVVGHAAMAGARLHDVCCRCSCCSGCSDICITRCRALSSLSSGHFRRLIVGVSGCIVLRAIKLSSVEAPG